MCAGARCIKKAGRHQWKQSKADDGKAYSSLEHHWDEAFGYFGAARDYSGYTDADIKTGGSKDTNGDGVIDLLSEKNYGLSINAAKRDLGAKDASTDFTGGAITAFIQGRHLIGAKPEGYAATLASLGVVAQATGKCP